MIPKGKLVLVKWIDPFEQTGWIDELELEKLFTKDQTCWTVGYLIREMDDAIYVAGSWAEGADQVGDVFKLPREVVLEIISLRKEGDNAQIK